MTRTIIWSILLAGLVLTVSTGANAQEPKRYRIPPEMIRPEIGFSYTAGMDFGEEGDKGSGNSSQLMVFEDGRPLGPPHALHADIREKGEGRFSHWTREGLYFSASDNTDPRANGRTYEVASTNPDSMLGGMGEQPRTEHSHVEEVTSSAREYAIEMGGTLDMENTLTVASGNYQVAFQPNLQLTIENTGDTPVVNPRLVINDRGNWYTFESLLEEFTRGAQSDQDRVYLIWENMRRNLYHETPLFVDSEPHDPVRLMNIFGFNLCDDAGNSGCSLYHHGGFPGSKNRALYGHVQCEPLVDGAFQFMDIDMDAFYLDRENEIPVSGDACARDHDLVRRELNYGPVVGQFNPSESVAALFGPDDTMHDAALRGHEIAYTLRPGERVEFRWDNMGKTASGDADHNTRPKYFGNSRFIYEPRLSLARVAEDAERSADIAELGEAIAATSQRGEIVYRVTVPYVIVGGTVNAIFEGAEPTDSYAISFSRDGEHWQELWSANGAAQYTAEVPLDEHLDLYTAPAEYEYFVRVELSSAGERGARLEALRIATDVMAAPQSLPRLRLGANRCVYTDATEGPHSVRITHQWHETDAITPLAPPAMTYPAAGAEVRDSILTYTWEPVEAAARYHLQVSRRQDFAWPYRTSLDVIIPTTSYLVPEPFTGIYSPGVTYYWRVRTQDRWGTYGPWSEPRSFTWQGPRVPVNVRLEFDGQLGTLRWEPNPGIATAPVRYEVHGSDEKGFTARRTVHNSYTRGEAPATLIGETTGTSMVVIGPDATAPNTNSVYYRVVAIDEAGTMSGNSDYAEAPHPFIISMPVTQARVGEEYRYELRSLRSLGDVQHHYEAPGNQFWDIEQNTFALAEGPEWLTIDPATGVLSGTPPGAGTFAVKIAVTNQFASHAEQAFELVAR